MFVLSSSQFISAPTWPMELPSSSACPLSSGLWEGERMHRTAPKRLPRHPDRSITKRKADPHLGRSGSGMENKVTGKRHSPYYSSGAKARSRLTPVTQLPSPSSSNTGSSELWAEGPDGRVPSNLPAALTWAEPRKLWTLMVEKSRDALYARVPDSLIFSPARHPDLAQPRIRAILLDWMLEVCEVYKLHRETFYLAVDFVDRFLSRTSNFTRSKLQLLGITALFAAAKLEEIYPPKCEEFAYVTDQACSDDDIRKFEGHLLQELEWRLSPVTPLQWLTAFLQLFHLSPEERSEAGAPPPPPSPSAFPTSRGRTAGLSANPTCLLKPQFERQTFLVLIKVLDVLVMQEESLRWSYAVLAGSVLASLLQTTTEPVVEVARVTGLPLGELRECVEFLEPTIAALEEAPDHLPPELREETRSFPCIRHFDDVHPDDAQNIQTRDASLRLYDYVGTRKDALRLRASAMEQSPELVHPYLTPPASSERPSSPPHSHLLDITNH